MRGPQPQKPLGTQCQLPPTLVPDVTNVLSARAPVVMGGVHPSVSLKRAWCQGLRVSRPAKCPPGSPTVSWWERQGEVCRGEAAGLSRGPGWQGGCAGL